jgi:hypothetical protein
MRRPQFYKSIADKTQERLNATPDLPHTHRGNITIIYDDVTGLPLYVCDNKARINDGILRKTVEIFYSVEITESRTPDCAIIQTFDNGMIVLHEYRNDRLFYSRTGIETDNVTEYFYYASGQPLTVITNTTGIQYDTDGKILQMVTFE